MNETNVLESTCIARQQITAERLARDKERIEKAEERMEKSEELLHKLSECQIQNSEILKNQAVTLDDHETRISDIEKKPGTYWDKVLAGLISAVVAFVMGVILK